MRLHRLAGWIAAVCMLHLSIVASDAMCATHAHHAVAAATAQMAGMQMSSPVDGSGAETASTLPGAAHRPRHHCATPVQANCCAALMSCGPTYAIGRAAAGSVVVARVRIARNVAELLLSARGAPEPPPPKA